MTTDELNVDAKSVFAPEVKGNLIFTLPVDKVMKLISEAKAEFVDALVEDGKLKIKVYKEGFPEIPEGHQFKVVDLV